jgi:hypothetical protein
MSQLPLGKCSLIRFLMCVMSDQEPARGSKFAEQRRQSNELSEMPNTVHCSVRHGRRRQAVLFSVLVFGHEGVYPCDLLVLPGLTATCGTQGAGRRLLRAPSDLLCALSPATGPRWCPRLFFPLSPLHARRRRSIVLAGFVSACLTAGPLLGCARRRSTHTLRPQTPGKPCPSTARRRAVQSRWIHVRCWSSPCPATAFSGANALHKLPP